MFSGLLQDFFVLDIATKTWSVPGDVNGLAPSPRAWHGFAAGRGSLYVHGGSSALDTTLSGEDVEHFAL